VSAKTPSLHTGNSFARLGKVPLKRNTSLVLLILLGLGMFLGGISAPDPYANSEERNTEISQTMYDTGDLLVPRIEGHPHLTKPPLFHWFVYAVSRVRGAPGLVSIRLVAALAAVACLLLTYLMGRQLFGQAAGWYAACLLVCTVPLFVHHAHRGTFDTTLAAFVMLALYGYTLVDGPHPWRGKILLVLGLVGAFMIKGPVAWIFTGVPFAIDSVRRRGARRTILQGLLLAAVVVVLSVPWYVVLLIRLPESRAIFMDAVRVNFGGKAESYSLAILCLPALRPSYLRQPDAKTGRTSELLAHFVLWSLLFLSLVPAKADRYLVPLAPAICLLVGRWFADHRDDAPGTHPWLNRMWRVAAIVAAVAVIGVPIWLWTRMAEPVAIAALFAAIMAAATVCLWRWRLHVTIPLIVATTLVGNFLFVPVLYERWEPRNRYLHENKHSEARRAYKERVARLKALVGIHEKKSAE
jgi:4-amino-4-deoxy-L-arabinose transferase-like glycosyltransferase